MGKAAMSLRREFCPGRRKSENAGNGTPHFGGKFKAQTGALIVVIIYRIL